MGSMTKPHSRIALLVIALALLLGGLYWAVAAPYLSSREEEMKLEGVAVLVRYQDAATADDLKMPFYPGAAVRNSFAYVVDAKDGRPVTQYASATLTTGDSWEKVAAYYSAQLPGNPEPETLGGISSKRHVLAVGNPEEVRTVTIRDADGGSRIELLRTKPSSKPLRPRRRESLI